jgi:hypothetical protein
MADYEGKDYKQVEDSLRSLLEKRAGAVTKPDA